MLCCPSRVRAAGALQAAPSKRLAPCCKFATGGDIAHYLQQELAIEGVLHVSAAQAGACMERFGDLEAAPAPGELPPLDDVLSPPSRQQQQRLSGLSRAGSGSDRVVNEAFCLATPPDNPSETNNPLRQALRTPPAASTNTASRAGASEYPRSSSNILSFRGGRANAAGSALEEEVLQLEAAVYQRAALSAHALYTSEVLRASEAVRRQRRRALVRLLRETRARTSASLARPTQLLASLADGISSLASSDADDDDDGGATGSTRTATTTDRKIAS